MTKLRHFDDLGTARFVTFSCFRRLPGLKDARAKGILIRHLDETRRKHGFKLLGYVIMPEHVHLVLFPPDGMKLGLVIREIKSRTAREHFAKTKIGHPGATRVFWEPRCYDHNCRSLESVNEKIEYCHYNPVKRGLVTAPAEWAWSSHNWYQGITDVPIQIDPIR